MEPNPFEAAGVAMLAKGRVGPAASLKDGVQAVVESVRDGDMAVDELLDMLADTEHVGLHVWLVILLAAADNAEADDETEEPDDETANLEEAARAVERLALERGPSVLRREAEIERAAAAIRRFKAARHELWRKWIKGEDTPDDWAAMRSAVADVKFGAMPDDDGTTPEEREWQDRFDRFGSVFPADPEPVAVASYSSIRHLFEE